MSEVQCLTSPKGLGTACHLPLALALFPFGLVNIWLPYMEEYKLVWLSVWAVLFFS